MTAHENMEEPVGTHAFTPGRPTYQLNPPQHLVEDLKSLVGRKKKLVQIHSNP